MKMYCENCGKDSPSEFDERLGEHTCLDCGLVLVTEIFEQTVHILDSSGEVRHSIDNNLGSINAPNKLNRLNNRSIYSKSIIQGLIHCNMVLSAIQPNSPLKDRVEEFYLYCNRKAVFGRTQYEARATAVVYYVLKENGTPHLLADVNSEFNARTKTVKRLLRKMNQLNRNVVSRKPINPQYQLEQVLLKINAGSLFNKQCYEVLEHFESIIVNSDFNKGRSYYACIAWIAANCNVRRDITKQIISKRTKFSEWVIWRQTKAILNLVGKDNVKQIKGKKITMVIKNDKRRMD